MYTSTISILNTHANLKSFRGWGLDIEIFICVGIIVNDNEIKLVLRDSVDIDPASVFSRIFQNFGLITPFYRTTEEFEILIKKNERTLCATIGFQQEFQGYNFRRRHRHR